MFNIGKGYAANADTVKYIISADAEKVRRILTKHGLERGTTEVLDATADGETRSLITQRYRHSPLPFANFGKAWRQEWHDNLSARLHLQKGHE